MSDSKSELLIRINADAKNAKKAFDDIREKTEDLEKVAKTVAIASGAAFAAFSAEIYFSVKAFQDAQQSANELTLALQNQGIFTTELEQKYHDFANAVSEKTGIDDDAIVKAQAVAQTYLHQTVITQDLTQAIADLGVSMGGDLNAAAEKIGRTIGTSTNAFARQGLVISDTLTTSERYAKVLAYVQQNTAGMAEEFNKANGYSVALNTSFQNFNENIGSKFFPIVSKAKEIAAGFFNILNKYEAVTQLAVVFIAVGTAITGTIAAIAVAIPAYLALSAAVATFGVAATAALAGLPLLIAAIVGGVTLIALNWGRITAAVAAGGAAIVETFRQIIDVASGVAMVFKGIFTLDPKTVDAGVTKVYESLKKIKDATVSTYQEIREEQTADQRKQDEEKARLAKLDEEKRKAHQERLVEINKLSIELIKMQNQNASDELIGLKQKELETLKALDEEKSSGELAALRQRLQIIRDLQSEAQDEEISRKEEFNALKEQLDAELDERRIEIDGELKDSKLAELQATAKTEKDIDRDVQEEILRNKIEGHNRELLDRKKYGKEYAAINKVLYSDEVQGAKSAVNDLVALQQSKNSTLKAIGKAAAVASITISTAESAMNIFKGFSTIPIIGPALGLAGAAAAVAFGAERIGQVVSAADGGLITGGVPGRDSVPAMLMPGELVVPKRNFEQVVGAVRGDSGSNNGDVAEILTRIENKLSTPQTTIIQGDVMADDSFVDRLCSKISDAIEFRNVKISGVNS
jgi:hypothetical protein